MTEQVTDSQKRDLPSFEAGAHKKIDELEQAMLGAPDAVVDLPLLHRFTPGLYIRQIFMPAGTLLTSKIHKTEHPYVILRGAVSVFIPGVGVERLEAPYVGVTKPGTRRILLIHEDCVWLTFHPTDETDLAVIEAELIERRELEDGSTAHEHYAELLCALDAQGAFDDPQVLENLPGQIEYGGAP